MKKTISVSLGGYNFYIEEDAYDILDRYLQSLKEYFAKYPESAEIIGDIEQRFAEQFQATGNREQGKIITRVEVENIIKSIGTVQEIAQEDIGQGTAGREEKNQDQQTAFRKFYRNPGDAMIAGVCSGIAAYFNIDPTIVRILFVVGLFFGGVSIVVYIILALILPEAQGPVEQAEMRGQHITLASIEQNVKKQLQSSKEFYNNNIGGKFGAVIRWPFQLLLRIINFFLTSFLPVVGKITGFCIVIFATLAMAFLIFMAGMVAVNANSPYWGIPLTAFVNTVPHYIMILSGWLGLFIPLIFIQYLGAYLIAHKKINSTVTVGLIFIWFVAVFAAASLFLRFLPDFQTVAQELPELKKVEAKLEAPTTIKKIDVQGNFRVHWLVSSSTAITVKGTQIALDNISVSSNADDTMFVSARDMNGFCIFVCPAYEAVEVTVYSPSFPNVALHDMVRFTADGVQTPSTSIELADMARANLNIQADFLHAAVQDMARLEIDGDIKKMEADIFDMGRLEASKALVGQLQAVLRDMARATVTVKEKIVATTYDASRLNYYGHPTTTIEEYDVSEVGREE